MHGDFTLNRVITGATGIAHLNLHVSKLSFNHPDTEERFVFKANIPQDFNNVFALEK